MTKRIILCADDYGQNKPVSQAIITLIEKKRLSAASCMTTFPDWIEYASWLQPYTNQVDLGLHFNLTEGDSNRIASLPTLILKAYLRRLDKRAILAELNRQLDLFVQGIGRLPDFIDGHQHVHQLPVIRDALIEVYQQRFKQKTGYIRCVYDSKAYFRFARDGYIKNCIIQLCGAAALKKRLLENQIPHNKSFSGAYHFAQSTKYATIFPELLKEVSQAGIIMCHPGLAGGSNEDVISNSRLDEFNYFNSELFLKDCQAENAIIERFCQID